MWQDVTRAWYLDAGMYYAEHILAYEYERGRVQYLAWASDWYAGA